MKHTVYKTKIQKHFVRFNIQNLIIAPNLSKKLSPKNHKEKL